MMCIFDVGEERETKKERKDGICSVLGRMIGMGMG